MTPAVSIAGVGLWGPGLQGWEQALPVLRGAAPLAGGEASVPVPAILPANERRRSGVVVRLAIEAAQGASAMAGLDPAALRCVFGSANGDGAVVHALLEALAAPPPQDISPTLFHNSVHNAAAGYWTIAVGSRRAATCLGCHDATFAAALLKAVAEVRAEREPVLLCVYDAPLPPPLAAARASHHRFAAAFVLLPGQGGRLGTLEVAWAAASPPAASTLPRSAGLHDLFRGNPAARSLRLLEAIARGGGDRFAVDYLDGHLAISVTPCSTAPAS